MLAALIGRYLTRNVETILFANFADAMVNKQGRKRRLVRGGAKIES